MQLARGTNNKTIGTIHLGMGQSTKSSQELVFFLFGKNELVDL
jgi:hypothetical protein